MERTELIAQAIHTACNMAQELQEFVDDAEARGDNLPATTALIDDWIEIWRQLEDRQ